MNKLGWTILAAILLVAGGFVLLIRNGGTGITIGAPPPDVSTAAVLSGPLAVPVAGVAPHQLSGTFDQERGGGTRAHRALDIAAPRGTMVVAAAPGVVEKLFESKDGGLTLYIRSGDRRWSHYYAHLDGYAPGLREGLRVIRGQLVGFVGDTGNAGPGNTHLHFAVNRMQPDEPWYRGAPVDPYPLLAGSPPAR